MSQKKTHKVIDLVYHEDEGNEVYVGTHQECLDWVSEQPDYFTYQVIPLLPAEIEAVNNAYNL